MKTTFQNGNKEVTVQITGQNEWTGGNNKRVYFDIACDNKRNPIDKLYEVIEGTSRDLKVTVGDRTFAYTYGIDANSNTKRAAINEAVTDLVNQIVAQ